jgi:L-amino acid N-acyltransferase YncA
MPRAYETSHGGARPTTRLRARLYSRANLAEVFPVSPLAEEVVPREARGEPKLNGPPDMPSRTDEEATVRAATLADAEAIAEIYNHYITSTVVTFEAEPVASSEIAQRMQVIAAASLPWLVAEVGGQVAGYAYASKWNGRSAYKFSAEITVYLAPARVGQGIGSKLYGRLFPILRERGMHAVIGGIALPNAASVALHEKLGLEKVALFKEVGFKFDRWIDVGYWQRTL